MRELVLPLEALETNIHTRMAVDLLVDSHTSHTEEDTLHDGMNWQNILRTQYFHTEREEVEDRMNLVVVVAAVHDDNHEVVAPRKR
jgi:hypothetical protein